ncbi:MAG: hypothetical protein EOM80_04390 [Erysipelotrichia bacterium]|nr:hypothetical protein [Erysipelotrichia bacterium]
MSNVNELFPFPADIGEGESNNSENQKPALPGFPEPVSERGLTCDELLEVRKMLAAFKKGELGAAVLPQSPVQPATEKIVSEPQKNDVFASIWGNLSLVDQLERDTLNTFKEIFAEIHNGDEALKVFWSLAGVFPVKKNLRHGTPEQKLFALNFVGDRFLQGLASFINPVRKKLLKAVAVYLSSVSEGYSFICMENDPFNPQYHERIPEASPSGRTIREMRGFLVVASGNNRVVRLGQVLT